MERLKRLILGSEDELVRRVMQLAREHSYAQLIPALEDDYRATVASISANLVQSLNLSRDVPELRATEDLATDPIASLGDRMAQARRGDAADVQLTLGLLKRYRQAYLDVVRGDGLAPEERSLFGGVVDRFFDRFELGYVGRWCGEAPGVVPKAIIDRSRGLSAERARYLTAFADLPIPVILLDVDGRVENINTAAARLFAPAGPRRLGLGLGPVRREPPPILLDEIEAFRAGPDRETSFERELETGKGTRYFQVRFNKMSGVDASDSGMLVSLTDLTYRRHAEEALRRSQAKYASLFENMLTGFAYTEVVLDRRNRPVDYTFLEVNEAFERITGLESPQLIGRRLTAVMPGIESGEADWIGALARVALTGETASFDAYLVPMARWYSASVYSATPGHVTLMLSDISELKFIQESLRSTRDYYLTLFEGFPALIWRAGPDGRVDYVNTSWLEFTGRRAEESTGERWLDDVHPDDRESRGQAIRRAITERGPLRTSYRLRRHDGVYRRIVEGGRFYDDLDGPGGTVLGCATDVGPAEGAGLDIRA